MQRESLLPVHITANVYLATKTIRKQLFLEGGLEMTQIETFFVCAPVIDEPSEKTETFRIDEAYFERFIKTQAPLFYKVV